MPLPCRVITPSQSNPARSVHNNVPTMLRFRIEPCLCWVSCRMRRIQPLSLCCLPIFAINAPRE
ncbi:predicted protein [Plenodomus lingam JN3]|uniref:Predicted protein n=1 Tax=Leptosphaeria maculans (strain JN3 / isolate v23.1.3 / race Av1-4-5-6-7-8) TaxID=985895 RepID=E4ZS33_LEPMJ|nr:predicted protein [Plenodomus lingam JN3]CBX94213.1 predicted protein [Plenodomus lingam JN3]